MSRDMSRDNVPLRLVCVCRKVSPVGLSHVGVQLLVETPFAPVQSLPNNL